MPNWTFCDSEQPKEFDDDYLVYCADNRYRIASYSRDYGWICGTYFGGIVAWIKIQAPVFAS